MDYLPFGLSFNSYSRAAITAQNFKFNAGSELEEMTDWYSTPFRKYDPSLGRFHGVDALAELYTNVTPSHFAGNNPIMFNDPTGLLPPTSGWDDEAFGGDSGLGNDNKKDKDDDDTVDGGELDEVIVEAPYDPYYEDGFWEARDIPLYTAAPINGNNRGGGHRGPLLSGISTYQTGPLAPPALPPALLPVPVATNSNSPSSIQLYNGNFDTADFLKFDQDFANDLDHFADYGEGALGLTQVGMLQGRHMLSLQAKVGTFSKFRSAYRGLGIARRSLGTVGTFVAAPAVTYVDYSQMKAGQISSARFTYRTTGTVASIITGIGVGASAGGPWGAAAGALVSLGTEAGEIAYDGLNWLWNETSQQIYNFQNALKYGWYPGR